MDYYTALSKQVEPVELTPEATSYFSKPVTGLDPRLFINGNLNSNVRNMILSMLLNHLKLEYYAPESWMRAWLAGSAVSYQWAADRDNPDLDCLVGVDFVQFRRSNPEYTGFSDREVAAMFNENFRKSLNAENFLDVFEITFYVNVKADIRDIKPYAAYSLTEDGWTVPPFDVEVQKNPAWEGVVQSDIESAKDILKLYSELVEKIKVAPNDAIRRNHESLLKHVVEQGASLYKDIHEKRGQAFSPEGEGYYDFNNYRWQAGKRTGVVQAMRNLHQISKKSKQVFNEETYGLDLPDTSILIRRASTRPRYY